MISGQSARHLSPTDESTTLNATPADVILWRKESKRGERFTRRAITFSEHRKMKYRKLALLLVLGAIGAGTAEPTTRPAAEPTSHTTAAQAMEMLTAGNKRFVDGHCTHPHDTAARRTELADGQHPYAIVLGCSDS